jgi:hypothetical protein
VFSVFVLLDLWFCFCWLAGPELGQGPRQHLLHQSMGVCHHPSLFSFSTCCSSATPTPVEPWLCVCVWGLGRVGEIGGLSGAPVLLPHPPPMALGSGIAGTKESLWVPTGLWPSCLWLSSFWPQLCSYKLQVGPQLGHPPGGSESFYPFIPDQILCCGVLLPRWNGQGPHIGQPILPHCEGLGGLHQCQTRALTLRPALSLSCWSVLAAFPLGSVSSRDPLLDSEVLLCRV